MAESRHVDVGPFEPHVLGTFQHGNFGAACQAGLRKLRLDSWRETWALSSLL